MKLNVGQIMTMIASTVNQEATAPTAASSEYGLWLQFINRSINEWNEANDWEELRKTHFLSSITSGSSIGLPGDFKKMAGVPILYGTTSEGLQYQHILPEQELLQSSNDKYSVINGNNDSGFYIRFNPATLTSTSSIEIQYYAHATTVSGASDVPLVEDAQYIIDRTIGFIFEARSDPRFQTQEQKARERLLAMIENHNLRKFNSYAGANPVIDTLRRNNFRVGRN